MVDVRSIDRDHDQLLRLAAFKAVRELTAVRGELTSADLKSGFVFGGKRIPWVNPQRGIFKPQQMRYLLSIRTVYPKPGGRVWYDDQRHVHRQIYDGHEAVEYAFMGTNPDAADNRWLREAMDVRVPIIYFLGISPGMYQAYVPTYLVGWDGKALKAHIAFGAVDQTSPDFPATEIERRYALRQVKQRLHQASFREAVITAYNGRCAVSHLPEQRLLDAAHIIEDKNERLGHAVVPNGLPLSKIHHAAFDAHLIGIDADSRIHVAKRLLKQKDGPLLETLKKLHLQKLYPPAREKDRPDRDRLLVRFDEFRGYE